MALPRSVACATTEHRYCSGIAYIEKDAVTGPGVRVTTVICECACHARKEA